MRDGARSDEQECARETSRAVVESYFGTWILDIGSTWRLSAGFGLGCDYYYISDLGSE